MPPDVVWDDEPASPDVVWDDAPAPAPKDPGIWMARGLGAVQGANPLVDELSGLGGAIADKLTGKPGTFGENYRARRDVSRAEFDAAEAARPDDYHLGELNSGLATMFVPGAGEATMGKTLLGSIGKGAAMGAAQGAGESRADLTRGEVGKAALDTGIGGLAGGAAGALGHGLGKVAEHFSGKAAAGTRLADADQGLKDYQDAYVRKRAAQAALGGEVAAAMKTLEHAKNAAANELGNFSPEEVAAAKAFLTSPKAAELERKAARNAMDQGADRLANRVEDAREAFEASKEALDPEAISAAGDEAMSSPFGKQIWPRVVRYASRAIPPAVGAAVGGVPGAMVGFGAAAVLGKPGTSISNAMRNPAVRRAAWQAVQSGTNALGKFGPALQRAATQGGIGMAHALHESLLESSPEYQHLVQRLLENSQGDQ